ncbi:Omp28-related outer membrane protein [uncultured Porphyromonas sp.]|uniref:Omp28-related outer membrane protein n=1 Tax=uncultured Porphyromonas sp. TaxID=159274 RepID=UPI00266C3591|nr:Omp28-related outer membrane protein [uncultured Porphyromonas sp.]
MKRILLLTSALLLSLLGLTSTLAAQQTLRADDAYLPLGHCKYIEPDVKGRGWSIGTFGDKPVGLWARASRSMLAPYEGCQVVGVRIGVSKAVNAIDVSLLNNIIKREKIVTKKADVEFGWNEVRFDKPVEITSNLNELVYGFQFLEKNIVDQEMPYFFYCDYNFDASNDAFYVNVSNGSFDSRARDNGALLLQLMIAGPADKVNDRASLSDPRMDMALDASGKLGVSYMVRNDGANDINQLEITYSVGGRVIHTDLQTETIKHLKELRIKTKGIPVANGQTLTARITKVNDRVTDLPGFQIKVEGVAEKTFARKVLLEQFSTENCSSCPAGHKYLDKVLAEDAYADHFVWVTHHVGFGRDTFSLPESEALIFFYEEDEYAPSMLLDRTHTELKHFYEKYAYTMLPIMTSQDEFNHQLLDEALARPAFVTVDIKEECKPETRQLDLTISGQTYREYLDADNLYLNLYLVEDDIYSRRQAGAGKASDGGLKPVYHHGVIRQISLGGGGLKLTLDDKGEYTYGTSLQIPKEWSAANMRIVAFVSKSLKGGARNAEVLNSNETKIAAYRSIAPTPDQEMMVQLYAQDGRIYVSGEDATIAAIYNMSGELMTNEALLPGIYIAMVETSFGSYMRRVIVH